MTSNLLRSAPARSAGTVDIRDAIDYCPETGIFRWKATLSKSIKNGAEAGCINKYGYRHICFNYRDYLAHRVAWFIMTGEWPNKAIDHRNLDRSDNRWCNLRLATSAQNQANRRGTGPLPKGVSISKNRKRFEAAIKFDHRKFFLGTFETAEEAGAAYHAAAIRFYGEFARTA
jgi:hypothetical protein